MIGPFVVFVFAVVETVSIREVILSCNANLIP